MDKKKYPCTQEGEHHCPIQDSMDPSLSDSPVNLEIFLVTEFVNTLLMQNELISTSSSGYHLHISASKLLVINLRMRGFVNNLDQASTNLERPVSYFKFKYTSVLKW